ncbi:hypothetical protein KIL84_009043 [Mauremys mutica]|uniref:Uncharacterized protein n=1 Tax=Mauremys mutica TaxID=74926 RepID=A0A9D4AXK8_9SAUR|nr:hypothetical protein KIL84_009043 [Mauremys mutica]
MERPLNSGHRIKFYIHKWDQDFCTIRNWNSTISLFYIQVASALILTKYISNARADCKGQENQDSLNFIPALQKKLLKHPSISVPPLLSWDFSEARYFSSPE